MPPHPARILAHLLQPYTLHNVKVLLGALVAGGSLLKHSVANHEEQEGQGRHSVEARPALRQELAVFDLFSLRKSHGIGPVIGPVMGLQAVKLEDPDKRRPMNPEHAT